MKVRSAGKGRSVQSSSATKLVPGQLVHGRVITRLSPGFFRIGAAGQVFVAESDIPLEAGQRLTARVEVGDAKVFLRILEDQNQGLSYFAPDIDPDEIKRILKGLGEDPVEADIIEFQERLERYRSHGNLQGSEPSDIWVLAIMWARKIRGGADSYALLSYYLRQVGQVNTEMQNPAKLTEFLLFSASTTKITHEPERAVADSSDSESTQPEEFHTARREETDTMLNRQPDSVGTFNHTLESQETCCSLFFKEKAVLRGRWVDNPTKPSVFIEAVLTQGRVTTRIVNSMIENSTSQDRYAMWTACWKDANQIADYEIESTELIEVPDPEDLRFLFWRKWESEYVRNLSV